MQRAHALVDEEAAGGLDIVCTGAMGIGNTTAAAAITAAITGAAPEAVTGRDTGADDARLAHKIQVARQALAVNRPETTDGLDVLAKVGGFELGGLAGVILGAAARRIAIVLDGYIAGAAALVAATLCPAVRPVPSRSAAPPRHAIALTHLGLVPRLDLCLRLGEGTGAVLALPILDAAVAAHATMATFAGAGVSGAAIAAFQAEHER